MGTSMKFDYDIRALEARYGDRLPKRGRGRPSQAEQLERAKQLKRFAEVATGKAETPQQRVKRIQSRFKTLVEITEAIINGNIRSLILAGAPGVGKTHTIESMLMEAEDMGKIRYKIIRGKLTPIELYMKLYQYRASEDVLLLDDSDAVYQDETGINILKAALDTGRQRTISWLSQASALRDNNVPSSFDYEGRLIVITNMDFQSIVDSGKGKLVPHLAALKSRAHYLDTQLHEPTDLVAWTAHMINTHHILEQNGMTPEQERSAVQWLMQNYGKMSEISLRPMIKIAEYMAINAITWREMAATMLFRK